MEIFITLIFYISLFPSTWIIVKSLGILDIKNFPWELQYSDIVIISRKSLSSPMCEALFTKHKCIFCTIHVALFHRLGYTWTLLGWLEGAGMGSVGNDPRMTFLLSPTMSCHLCWHSKLSHERSSIYFPGIFTVLYWNIRGIKRLNKIYSTFNPLVNVVASYCDTKQFIFHLK